MKHLMLLTLLLAAHIAMGQKYYSKTGKVSFFSNAPMEKIEAHTSTANTVLDVVTGQMEWAVLIQSFQFEKALMQEHFNENYMESATYPKAKFKGTIENLSQVSLTKDGTYPVTVKGDLDIHGVTKPVTAEGSITVKNGAVAAKSKFSIKVADYGIEVPKLVAENIAKDVEIHVEADYMPLVR